MSLFHRQGHFAGFALLPTRETAESVIGYRNATPSITGPALGLETNLPHLTLFQGIYPRGFDPEPVLDRLAAAAGGVAAPITELTSEPGAWAFLSVHPSAQLTRLHELAADASAPVMSAPPAPAGMDKWAPTEAEAFARYGYRYARAAYLPHITLGTASEITEDAWARFVDDLAGWTVDFDQVVFYRAGERGALAEVLAARDLQRAMVRYP